MLLIDASAWIDYLQRPEGAVGDLVDASLRDGSAATTDVVVLEILSGTTNSQRLERWKRLLARCEYLEQAPRQDAQAGAALYRACRVRGETPRAPNDCLVAAVAIRRDAAVLHRDRDFEVIARHTALRTVQA